jgi:hypothetical protein
VPSIERSRDGSLILRGGGYKVLLAILIGAFPLIGLAIVVSASGISDVVFGAVLLLGTGWFWIRWIRAQVRLGIDRLILRTPFRTHELPRLQGLRAEVVPTNALGVFCIVLVTLPSGRSIKVDGVGGRYRRGVPDETVAEMARAITDWAAHSAGGEVPEESGHGSVLP